MSVDEVVKVTMVPGENEPKNVSRGFTKITITREKF